MIKKNKITSSTYIIYFLLVAVFVTVRMLSGFGVLSGLSNEWSIVINSLIQVAMFALPVFLFSLINKQKVRSTLKFFQYKKITGKAWIIAIGIGLVAYILNLYIASFFDSIIGAFGYREAASTPIEGKLPFTWLLLNTFTTALLPALCEETAHRGMLLKGSTPMGYSKAIWISALLFGLLHMNIEQFFYATILGAFMGYLTVLSDSIYPAMVVHFINNFMGVYLTFSMSRNLPIGKAFYMVVNFMSQGSLLSYVFIIALLVFLVMTMIILIKKLFRETAGKAFQTLQAEMVKDLMKQEYIEKVAKSKRELTGKEENPQSVSPETIYLDKNVNLGLMTNIDREVLNGNPYKRDVLTTVFYTLSLVLSGACTIFTLIWGII